MTKAKTKASKAKAGRSAAAAAERRKLFVERYLVNGHNATEAAAFAGFSKRSARKQGWQMVHEPDVALALAERARQAVEAARVSSDKWMQELAALAFCDVEALPAAGGKLKDKLAALALLGRHLGVFEKDNGQQSPDITVVIDPREAARRIAYTLAIGATRPPANDKAA